MEITNGNIPLDNAYILAKASPTQPAEPWIPGDTEPWIIHAVQALALASGNSTFLELGGYTGACSRALAEALHRLGGGRLIVMELDTPKAEAIAAKATEWQGDGVRVEVWNIDTLEGIPQLEDRSIGVAWVDSCHDAPHVVEEVALLIPKMRDDGLILFHDVCGEYGIHQLVRHYGGVGLNLPRVSSSGGLGILQIRPSTREIPKLNLNYGTGVQALIDGGHLKATQLLSLLPKDGSIHITMGPTHEPP